MYNKAFFNNENGLNQKEICINSNNILVDIPNYCSFESRPSYFEFIEQTPMENIIYNNRIIYPQKYNIKHFSCVYKCISCHRFVIIDYELKERNSMGYNYIETEVIPYDYSFTLSYFPFKNKEAEMLNEIAPKFEKIYRQASKAEAIGLDELEKMGYRKAAEALAKGVLINIFGTDENATLNSPLGSNISELKKYINENKVDSFQLATWIGNDGTHFIEKNPDLKIEDMKRYIFNFASSTIMDMDNKHAKIYIDKHNENNNKQTKN